jgi:hypothetical protein
MSTTPVTGPRTEPGGYGVEWNATIGPNGRQYGGTGRGGQSLIVWPELDMFLLDVNFIANINHYTLAIKFLPDGTIEVSADEASGLIRNGKLVGTPR